MDLFWLLLAVAVALGCVFGIVAVMFEAAPHCGDWRTMRTPTNAHVVRIADLGNTCMDGGLIVTPFERLRTAVKLANRLTLHSNGRDALQLREDADNFARQQTSPDVTLETLARCDETLLHRYPHGYWMINSALVRESARRRGVTDTLVATRAP